MNRIFNSIITTEHPVIKGHLVHGQVLLPGLAYIDMLYQLACDAMGLDFKNHCLKHLTILNPLTVSDDRPVKMKITFERSIDFWKIKVEGTEIVKQENSPEKVYITGELHERSNLFEEKLNIEVIKQVATKCVDIESAYAEARKRGLIHQGLIKAQGNIYLTDLECLIDISVADIYRDEAGGFLFHPTLIDGAATAAGVLKYINNTNGNEDLYLPLYYESFFAIEPLRTNCYALVNYASYRMVNDILAMDIIFMNAEGKQVAELKGITGKRVRYKGQINQDFKKENMSVSAGKSSVISESSSQKQLNDAEEINSAFVQMKSQLRGIFSKRLNQEGSQIDLNTGFFELGLESSQLLAVLHDIENQFDLSLNPILLFEHTTIAGLADYLTENYASKFSLPGVVAQEVEQEAPSHPSLEFQQNKTPITQESGHNFVINDVVTTRTNSATSCFTISPAPEEEIAIIGMAGRFPGAANIQEFWNNLKDGKDCISEIPKSRWDWRRLDGVKSPSGKSISKWGGFIDDPDCFDPLFFKISPREAETLDPQERLFLETCWEAIEDAGYTPKTLVTPEGPSKRQHVGVFVGVMHKDYTFVQAEAVARGEIFPLSLNYAPIANRVSYFCDFHGPSIAVDTVCSSSLTALHLALESIKHGECKIALAGGVNLSLHPNKYLTYGVMNMHSSDGYCHTFGAGGDGYVSGEGIGAVLLKPLSKAIIDGDHIYAVIKGSSINHGGTASGITVPSPVAQADMICECIEKTKINPRTISYIEAHGTGTSLGDPIEIQGLVKAFRQYTKDLQYCAIGSVKSNIGHAESAAGISALIKVALQLNYKTLVKSLHAEEINPYIDFKNSPFYVQQKTEKWKQPVIIDNGQQHKCPRRAGISSFGATGSNAHIILEENLCEEISQQTTVTLDAKKKDVIIPLSALNNERLQAYAGKLLDFLKGPVSKRSSGQSKDDKKTRYQKNLEAGIRKILSDVICVEEEAVDVEQEWREYGLEPVQIIQVKDKIQKEFEIELKMKDLSQRDSVVSIVEYLLDKYSEVIEAHDFGDTFDETASQKETEEIDREINIVDLAYTLQVGREALDERVAFVVKDIPELMVKLEAFVKGKEGPGNYWRGQVKQSQEFVNFFNSDRDSLELIHKWIAKGNLRKIAELWVKGYVMDWKLLYKDTKQQRISIPTYPFAKGHYWAPKAETISFVSNASTNLDLTRGHILHPLLHQNTSTFLEQRFSSILTGQEFFLTDHIVNGQRVFPGVAHLEMARAAASIASGALEEVQERISLKNIVWTRPIVVGDQPVRINIRLFPEDNGEIIFEVYSELEEVNAEPVVYSQGSVILDTISKVPTLDIKALQDRCNQRTFSATQCYEAFRTMGIVYGPGHQGIEKVYLGTSQALAKLSLPSSVSDTKGQFVLHPSLMDSALQASICLVMGTGGASDKLFTKPVLPFTLSELEIFGNCPSTIWALIRNSDGNKTGGKIERFDIELCDEQGNIYVRMKGLLSRVLEGETGRVSPCNTPETLLLEFVWKEQNIPREAIAPDYNKHLVMLCEMGSISPEKIKTQMAGFARENSCLALKPEKKNIEERFQTYSIKVFEEIQKVIKDKPADKVLIQIVVPNRNEQQLFSGLLGLLKTAHLENQKIIGQLIEAEPNEDSDGIIEKLKENSRRPLDNWVRYQSGKRWVAGLGEATTPEKAEIPWKDHGIYLITGGAGGLGLIFCKEIVSKVKDATLILTGRSSLDGKKQTQLQELEGLGSRVIYKQIDVTQKEAITDLIRFIRSNYGKINGIIHGAGVIRDNYILNKTREEMLEVLAPKVTGLVNLDQASKDLDLEFFALFSSMAGSFGNPGQADYSTANAFMDAFANYRNTLVAAKQRHGHTVSINWPLWKEGGMNVDEEIEKMMLQNMGIIAMQTHTGIQVFYKSLSSGKTQLMVMEGMLSRMREKMHLTESAISQTGKTSMVSSPTIGTDSKNISDKVQADLIKIVSKLLKVKIAEIDPRAELSEYGFDSISLTQFANKLNEEYKLDLTPTVFFEYPTIYSFSEYLIKEYQAALKIQSVTTTPSISQSVETPKTSSLTIETDSKSSTDIVQAALIKTVSKLLKVKIEDIDPRAELSEYGFDSISLTQFANKLNEEYTLNLTPTVFFEYPTLYSISEYLIKEHREAFTVEAQTGINNIVIPFAGRDKGNKNGENFFDKQQRPRFTRTAASPLPKQDINSLGSIAIVGMSGIFPQARDIDEFWTNLVEGKNCITEVPKERWDWKEYCYGFSNSTQNSIKWGGFIDGVAEFDPLFFEISPGEAKQMDPQQRLMMTSVWKAIEDAGFTPETISQKQTGVFIAAGAGEYMNLVTFSRDNPLAATAVASSMIPNRISYLFNLRGPSEYCETACSSTLVALHRAIQSIQNHECEQAIVGAVNLLLSPKGFIAFDAMGYLSPDGQAKSFQADANGYVRSEGVGAIIIKPLQKAIEERNHIYAVIKGTGVAHGGKGMSLTAPNIAGMKAAMLQAYRTAAIDPRTVSYIEAHGIASPMADAIELNTLKSCYQELAVSHATDTQEEYQCYFGSLKPCIGHGEIFSGMAALFKVVSSIRHQIIPGVPSIKTLNEHILLEGSPFHINAENQSWGTLTDLNGKELPRRASINSYGFGGVNAHAVLEEYIPPAEERIQNPSILSPQIVVLSAKNHGRLETLVRQMFEFIERHPEISLSDFAYTLQVGRKAMETRIAIVVNNHEELLQGLKECLKFMKEKNKVDSSIPVFTGNPGANQLGTSILLAGKAGESVLKALLAECDPSKIAFYWTQGGEIPWESLYVGDKPCRLSLPTYPFENHRYWIESKPESRGISGQYHSFDEDSANKDLLYFNNPIIKIVSRMLGLEPAEIEINKPLQQYGFDSILLMQLLRQLQNEINPEINLVSLVECSTLQDIINVLEPKRKENLVLFNEQTQIPVSTTRNQYPELIHLNQKSEGRPVFWFHGGLGGVEIYQSLAQKSKRPFYGIQARGWMTERTPLEGIVAMATYYINIIQSTQPEGPYDLGGYSLGGVLAYEVTRQLQELGESVDTIVMLDSPSKWPDGKFPRRTSILQAVNLALMSNIFQEPEKFAQTLIHRREVELNMEDEIFFKELISLAKTRGLTKTEVQLHTMIESTIRLQQAYQLEQLVISPLINPKEITCYYFRNKNGLLYGELESYFSIDKGPFLFDQTNYWEEWKRQIPDLHIMDVDAPNHMIMLSEPKVYETIYEFCKQLYSEKGMTKEFLKSFMKRAKK